MLVYKILPRPLWDEALDRGVFEGAPVDLADGFIHLSSGDQVRETARLHFAGQSDLVLVAFEAADLGPALRWEASRAGAKFPHLYGPLVPTKAVSVVDLPLDQDGQHGFPPNVS